jgi:hypothetical protein
VAVTDDLAYTTGGDGTLHIFDINNPAQPTLVAAYMPADFDFGWQRIYDLSVINERGYAVGLASDRTVLLEFDLSDPHNLQVASKTYWLGSAERVVATENSVYVYSILFTDQTTYELRHFKHIDGELTLVSSVEIGSQIYDVLPMGNMILLGTADGLTTVATDAVTGQLTVVVQAQIAGGSRELARLDELLLATTAEFWGSSRLLAIDLQNLTHPRLIGSMPLPASQAQLAVSDEGVILIGNATMGLMVFEINHE